MTSQRTRGFVPRRWAPVLFGALLSFLMVVVVTGIATVRTTGIGPETPALWWGAFVVSWPVAFPTVLLVAPLVRRAVARLVIHESPRNTGTVTSVTAA